VVVPAADSGFNFMGLKPMCQNSLEAESGRWSPRPPNTEQRPRAEGPSVKVLSEIIKKRSKRTRSKQTRLRAVELRAFVSAAIGRLKQTLGTDW
jgi:hypothetical protein